MLSFEIVTGARAEQLFDMANMATIEDSNTLEMDIANHNGLVTLIAEGDNIDRSLTIPELLSIEEEVQPLLLGLNFDTHISKPTIVGGDIWEKYKTYHCLWLVFGIDGKMRTHVVYLLLDSCEGDADPEAPVSVLPEDPMVDKFNKLT